MKPTSSEVQQRIESLVRSNQVMFSQDNEINFKKYCTEYGRKSINELIMEINALPFKTPQLIATNSQDPQMCVLKYLESKGINAGRTPQEPVVVQSQLLS
ncbi:hypothetical protein CRE_22033 [Caenorhabditis remanei]|uniref:Uncharacterized protein n=1 Tax=Caenorhabditis remanei TaxID=31234 RepID=E3N3H0_CAERE|nr:hypothetical protein CRE_22033 [Caenorhabditis remanei]